MKNIMQHRKLFFGMSGVLIALSLIFIALGGLHLGIDFTGGTLMELSFEQRPTSQELQETLQSVDIEHAEIQESGEKEVLFRFRDISEDEHSTIHTKIQEAYGTFSEDRFEVIGPTIGQELKRTSFVALVLVVIAIIAYIAYTFRKVSRPVKSWKYGLAAIIALIHDILIVTGLFAVLGYIANIEISLLFVTALLTILGFSVNDTIVVFDRTRENLLQRKKDESFGELVGRSINETLARSVNTSLTTLLVLLALYFFGGESIQWFIVALIAGVIVGTYSSIFIASALLVEMEQRQKV